MFCVAIRSVQFPSTVTFPDVTFPTSTDLVNFATNSTIHTSGVTIAIPSTLLQERSAGSKYKPLYRYIY